MIQFSFDGEQDVIDGTVRRSDGAETVLGEAVRSAYDAISGEYAWVLAPDTERDGGKPASSGREREISMAVFAEKLPHAYDDLAEEVEEMGRHFMDYVGGTSIKSSWRYISDVIITRTDEQLQRVVSILREYGRTRRNGLFGFSVESDHIHVIHDCAFSGSHCRDVWRKQVEPFAEFGPTRSENKPIWKFTRTDWYDVFIYFFLKKRGTREIWVRGENWQKPTNGKQSLSLLNNTFCCA